MSVDGVWGDGFACDALFEASSAREWAQLCEGEAVRFFPGLRRRCEALSPQLRTRVLARADEIERRADRSNLKKRKGNLSARRPGAGGGGVRGWPLETGEDACWLRWLVSSGNSSREVGDLRLMARFAFLTGLHPAYLWPEIEILPSWGATAAWLGELSRRGRAFMPPEVAEYLNDVLTESHGRTVLRDESLTNLLRDEALASILLTQARRCIAGDAPEVRYPSRGSLGATIVAATGRARRRIRSIFSQDFRRPR